MNTDNAYAHLMERLRNTNAEQLIYEDVLACIEDTKSTLLRLYSTKLLREIAHGTAYNRFRAERELHEVNEFLLKLELLQMQDHLFGDNSQDECDKDQV